ncbi:MULTISPECIES: NERD domain-containing protein [Brucella/Ochrobactrum group]|jgi:Holliday junction resolvase-like predicted endonuclease|uniref:NERD domain-containing protein n=1 Tax=Ochrobactrum sp. AP1BH01-1 TaxID=2823874 RepID=UPI001B35BE9C|nr:MULTISPECIES: NERD domain-containing protein [Brucella/Ochrobactrum group]MBQ0707749.1 NERD domain-containing protein [Ochrobactrum sp. AP1BH01-1]
MPAYRSSAEGEIRDAVVAFLRQHRPDARIIHEINASFGGNRIDVMAVDRAEIIAVEIKSAKDKLDRLDSQMNAMQRVSHHALAVLHEKFLVEYPTNMHAAHFERDGAYFRYDWPEHYKHASNIWCYPQKSRAMNRGYDWLDKWKTPQQAHFAPLPDTALQILWHEELRDLCNLLAIPVGKRPTNASMINALRWLANGRDLTRGICWTLRARACIEADPAIIVPLGEAA